MITLTSRSVFLLAAVAVILLGAPAAADVGARVYVQAWDPTQPDRHLFLTQRGVVEGDAPAMASTNAVSAAVNAGWNAARAVICDKIEATLRAANGGSKGISFKEIYCQLQAGTNLALISTAPYSSKNFLLRFMVSGNNLDMHTTTPNVVDDKVEVWGGAGAVLGGQALGLPGVVVGGVLGILGGLFGQEGLGDWADPEFKIYYDLTADVVVDGRNVLQTGLAMFNVQNIQITNVRADPANASGSIIKAATDFAHAIFQTPAFNALVSKGVQDGVNQKDAQGHDLKDNINIYIRDFNTTMMAAANQAMSQAKLPGVNISLNPNNYIALPLWGKNNMISLVVALKPLNLPLSGAVQGYVRMMKNQVFSSDVCPPSPGLYSEVKNGPAPVLDVDPLQYGDPPVGNFGYFQYFGKGQVRYARSPVGTQVPVSFDCPYSLLVPGFVPNLIRFNNNGTGGLTGVSGPSKAAQGTGAHVSTVFTMKPIGWDPHVVPNPTVTGKDWEASVGRSLTGSVATVPVKPYIDKGDPAAGKISPVERINPGAAVSAGSQAGSQPVQKANPAATKMLNPQPLPPGAIQQQNQIQR